MSLTEVRARRKIPLETPTDLAPEATKEIAAALTVLLADFFALYLKTKNFHWHVSGPHFRDHHLLFDEQGEQIFAATGAIAERVRKIGGTTLRSISQIARLQRVVQGAPDECLMAGMVLVLTLTIVAALSADATGASEISTTLTPEALKEIARVEAEIDRIETQTLERLAAPPDNLAVRQGPLRKPQ